MRNRSSLFEDEIDESDNLFESIILDDVSVNSIEYTLKKLNQSPIRKINKFKMIKNQIQVSNEKENIPSNFLRKLCRKKNLQTSIIIDN